MREYVDQQQISGAVTLIASKDRVLAVDAVGLGDVAGGVPMKPDTIFWIASMTKTVTATAILMLQDEGKLSVDDPVGKYIPELAHLKTVDGVEHVVTIRHLLTHTSGLSELDRKQPGSVRTLAELIPRFADKPLLFEPGTQWKYCQTGINSLGRIIEVVSGQSFPDFLQARLFDPLGMKDTTFYPTAEQYLRIAKSYKRTQGKLVVAATPIVGDHAPAGRDYYAAANGGLFTTAPDFSRFCRMILNHGELDGHRYLKRQWVELMTSPHTGDLKAGFAPGESWGLGWCVVTHPQTINAMLTPGTHGHGGAFGTQHWIDQKKGLIFILMVQRADFNNNDESNVRVAFQKVVAGVQ